MKAPKCITLDETVIEDIEKQAKKEIRNFSNMIEKMAKEYLSKKKK